MARKTKEEALETRNLILDAAENVFSEKGVAKTALSDIAQAANVSRGAIYWHFKNKNDLFDAMCDRVREPMHSLIESLTEMEAGNPLEELSKNLPLVMHEIEHNPHYRKVFNILLHKCEYLSATDPVYIYFRDWKEHSLNTIRRILNNAQERGYLPPDLDLHYASLMMHITFHGLLSSWLFHQNFNLTETAIKLNSANMYSLKMDISLRKPSA